MPPASATVSISPGSTPVPAQLDLAVGATPEQQHAVAAPDPDVTRPVHPHRRLALDPQHRKALGVLGRRRPQVPDGQPVPGDADLAGLADRGAHLAAGRGPAQHEHLGTGQRGPDRDAAGRGQVRVGDVVRRGEDRRLDRPVTR
jgi:hypothetical protein